jgi:hypothetical protein
MERIPNCSLSERYRSIKYFIRSSVMIKFNKICPPLSCRPLRYEHLSKIHLKKGNFQRNEEQIKFDKFLPRLAPEFLAINVSSKNIMIIVYKSVIFLLLYTGVKLAPQFKRRLYAEGIWKTGC